MTHYDVAILGAGFCGSMVAVHLSRSAPGMTIALIERNERHGPGLAYATADIDHLLNVRAANMSAFPDRPDDFWDWLQADAETARFAKSDFVPRQIYGHYIEHRLRQAHAVNPGLTMVQLRITDIARHGAGFDLTADDGQTLSASKVVLALGNFPPDQMSDARSQNPYDPRIWRDIADDGDVLIVGTGLTSLDLIVTLAKTKSAGMVHLLSRHGYLPCEHAATVPYPCPFDATSLPRTALQLLITVRRAVASAAAQGIAWQSVIDALRPLNQSIWQALPHDEKRRFLRHLRAHWDVHRHRCAGQVMDAYRALQASGRLQLHHGPILSRTADVHGWAIKWRERGTTPPRSFHVRHVVSCTGPQADFRKLDDPLVQNLLRRGLVMSDPLHLGICTDDDDGVVGSEGQRVEGLYALGSILKGRLYESVAVPELKMQAADIAKRIGASL